MGETKRRGTYAERKAQGEIETEQIIKKLEASERRLPRSKDHHNALAIAALAAGMMAPRLTATGRTPSVPQMQDFRTSRKRHEATRLVDLEALTDDVVMSEIINVTEGAEDFSGFHTGLQTSTVAKEDDLESPAEQTVPETDTRSDGPEFLA